MGADQRDRVGAAYSALGRADDFIELRARLKRFVVPVTIGFLAWYVLYVICSAWARGFMGTKVMGNVNVGLVFGLLQFGSTFLIAWAYGRYARRRVDPLADGLRAKFKKERRRR